MARFYCGLGRYHEEPSVVSLSDLLAFLKAQRALDESDNYQLPIDMTELPVFGGEEPEGGTMWV